MCRENNLVRVTGQLKSFNNRRYINATHVKKVADPHELFYHMLEVMTVTRMLEHGPVRTNLLLILPSLGTHVVAARRGPSKWQRWRRRCISIQCSGRQCIHGPVQPSSSPGTANHYVHPQTAHLTRRCTSGVLFYPRKTISNLADASDRSTSLLLLAALAVMAMHMPLGTSLCAQ